ncbi:hypothetical protein GQ600_26575 [Phytophthora cactorum]|nr:hypothetical protein GQ600_26575 [Phytophthora cactorum]
MVAATAYFGYLQAALITVIQEQSQTSTNGVQTRQLRLLLASGSGLLLLSIVTGGLWIFSRDPSGLASWLLALLIKLIDGEARVKWSGAPCTSTGKNSIVIYGMHFAPFAAKPLKAGGGYRNSNYCSTMLSVCSRKNYDNRCILEFGGLEIHLLVDDFFNVFCDACSQVDRCSTMDGLPEDIYQGLRES